MDIDIGQSLYVSNSIPQCPLTLCMSSPATTKVFSFCISGACERSGKSYTFVKTEFYALYLATEVPDTSIETLHEVTMGTELYQLYDGTIHLWGCKKLFWYCILIDK